MFIRSAISSDHEAVIDLLKQVAALHVQGRPDIFKPNALKYTKEEFLKLLEDTTKPIFVAEIDEKSSWLCVLSDYYLSKP